MLLKISSKLIGFQDKFKLFVDLYKKEVFPKAILFEGQQGIGKFTFACHFLNSILNKNNIFDYEKINKNPSTIIFNNDENNKEYKIEEIRKIINFCNFKTLNDNPIFILIKNINLLNNHAANALLKLIEEQKNNVYFIFTSNASANLSETLRSRLFVEKFFLNKKYYAEIVDNYNLENNIDTNESSFVNIVPGIYIKEQIYRNFSDLNEIKKTDEGIFFNLFGKKLLSKSNKSSIADLKKLKLNINLKNDIKFLLKKYS